MSVKRYKNLGGTLSLMLFRMLPRFSLEILLGTLCFYILTIFFYDKQTGSINESSLYLQFESISRVAIFAIVIGAGYIMGKFEIFKELKFVFVSLVGVTVFPFLMGFVLNSFIFELSFKSGIAVGIISSATSVPVIYRIFVDNKIINTRFASLVLFVAETQTLLLSFILSLILDSNLNRNSEISKIYLLALIYICPIIAILIFRKVWGQSQIFQSTLISTTAFIIFLITYVLYSFLIAKNQLFTGMVLGWYLSEVSRSNKLVRKLDIVYMINFLIKYCSPFYFIFIGFKFANISDINVILLMIFFLLTSISKIVGVLFALYISGNNGFHRYNFAFALNVRGGPSIIFADLALQNSKISPELFCVFVLIAIFSAILYSNYLTLFLNRNPSSGID